MCTKLYKNQKRSCQFHVDLAWNDPLLTAKGVDLVVAPFVIEIVHIFHSGYFDCRGALQAFLDSKCCVTG